MANTFVTLELKFKPGILEGFMAQLPPSLEETRLQPGFVHLDIYQNADDPDCLVFSEQWETAEQYRRYVQWRTETGLFDQLADLMAAPPAIKIWDKLLLTVTK